MAAIRVGVKEIDALLRKLRRQDARIERGKSHVKVWPRSGDGDPCSINTSKSGSRSIRNKRSQLRRMGYDV